MEKNLDKKLRHIHHYPKHGIDFIDITTVLKNSADFEQLINELVDSCKDLDFDVVVAAEARGFIIGAALAYAMHKAFVPIRKAGKLPAATYKKSYQLEYGEATIEMHKDALQSGSKVIFVDDLLAIGGTAKAACEVIEASGAKIQALLFFIELAGLNGRECLKQYDVRSLYLVHEDKLD